MLLLMLYCWALEVDTETAVKPEYYLLVCGQWAQWCPQSTAWSVPIERLCQAWMAPWPLSSCKYHRPSGDTNSNANREVLKPSAGTKWFDFIFKMQGLNSFLHLSSVTLLTVWGHWLCITSSAQWRQQQWLPFLSVLPLFTLSYIMYTLYT